MISPIEFDDFVFARIGPGSPAGKQHRLGPGAAEPDLFHREVSITQDLRPLVDGFRSSSRTEQLRGCLLDRCQDFGVDMAQDDEYASQRPSCEYFIGLARGMAENPQSKCSSYKHRQYNHRRDR